MIISHTLKYVYIGIPRTGSKSMNRWLMDHFQGEWFATHHEWRVPDVARDYLIFTLVRNPYEREMSAYHFVPWSATEAKPPLPLDEWRTAMRETIPLRDGTSVIREHEVPEVRMNQVHYVKKAGVSLVLHFEQLPACLKKLPFADADNLPPFPHMPERGARPPGNFFDHFTAEDEQLVWEYAAEDFTAFGYRRFECRLV